MSVLETPRIYFKGEVSWDPITTNNSCSNYNETVGESVLPGAADPMAAFRAQAIAGVTTGNWNPHGTHRAAFYNAEVRGFDTGGGTQTKDPFVTAAADFKGMLVDIEPFGSISSQLFFDSMSFGVAGGYRIFAPRSSRFTARYINFSRNSVNRMIAGVASVVWQASFDKTAGLRIDAFDSPALHSLACALEADDVRGLTIRFNAYRTIYYNNPNLRNRSPESAAAAKDLVAKLNQGGFQPNPARSLMVGVIGLWRKGEPAHEPGDRALLQAANIGSGYLRVNAKSVVLDLSNSVPEVTENFEKQNLGPLTLVAVDPDTQAPTTLGSFDYPQYDRGAYEATAGIVTVPLADHVADTLAGKDIQLQDASGTPLLIESPLRAIPATPNLYLDEGDHATATFQVYRRGVPVAEEVSLKLCRVDAAGDRSTNVADVTTDAKGLLTVPIVAGDGSITAYVPAFTAGEEPVAGINTQANTYMYVRVRPADSPVAQLAPTWDNVYNYVLINWKAMAPCMDNWLDLSDGDQVKAHANLVRHLTDKANFESYLFMPVTRDMTAGERTLLYNFLSLAPATNAPQPQPLHALARLSRSMRRM